MKIEELTKMILDEIQFTRDYQDAGIKAPVWQEVSRCISMAKRTGRSQKCDRDRHLWRCIYLCRSSLCQGDHQPV